MCKVFEADEKNPAEIAPCEWAVVYGDFCKDDKEYFFKIAVAYK